jgi:hypothetical protein
MEKLQVKETEEMRECTFKPKLIRRAKSSMGRSLKKFLEDQQRYQETKKSRQVLRAEHNQALLSQDLTFKPLIDPLSKRMIESKREQS